MVSRAAPARDDSALGGWGVGIALDAGGGPTSVTGWLAGFLVMAAGVLLGPLALLWSRGSGVQPATR